MAILAAFISHYNVLNVQTDGFIFVLGYNYVEKPAHVTVMFQ